MNAGSTASAAGAGSGGPVGAATLGTCSSAMEFRYGLKPRLRPLEGALLPGIVVPHDQDEDEHEHLDQAEQQQLVEDDRPRKHEHGLDVEDDKEHRHQV